MEPTAKDSPARAAEGRQLFLVGGLLVVIVTALAALWLVERARRARAETEAADLRRRQDAQGVLQRLIAGGGLAAEDTPGAVRRGDLPSRSATLDGTPRTVFRISASAGERFGFRPGDVIEVAERQAESRPDDAQDAPGKDRVVPEEKKK